MGSAASKTYELLENLYYYEDDFVEEDPEVVLELPKAVLLNIFSRMPGVDVGKASAVSKQWNKILKNSEHMWKYMFYRDFTEGSLITSSGRTWKDAYGSQYSKHVQMFKKNTTEIARIVGFKGFDPESATSYNKLVGFMDTMLQNNIAALEQKSTIV